MALWCSIVYACLLILSQLSLFVSSFQYVKPKILTESGYSETTLETGENFTVICEGNSPLKWQWPTVATDSPDYATSMFTKVHYTDVIPVHWNYTHASRLYVENASYPYTGYYTCYGENIDPSDEEYTDSIYLYVRDDVHLSVTSGEVDTVIVTQYSVAVLPCRPTSPDVDVELTLITGEKLDNATYDPQTGFRFYVAHLSDEELYCCSFLRGSLEHTFCIYVRVLPLTSFLHKPIVEEVSGGHTTVGGTLILECKIQTQTNVIFQWTTPTGRFDESRISSSQRRSSQDPSILIQRLIINETVLEDKGTYYCNVTDNQNHISSSSLDITVYGSDDHFINFTEDSNIYTITERAGASNVTWNVDVKGHPQPELFWLNNKNETIEKNTNKYFVRNSDKEAFLQIKDINIEDFGNYTLIAQNDYERKSISLFLNVTDKPSVDMEKSNFHMLHQNDKIKCRIAANPRPSLQWSFKPCLDDSCQFEPLNDTSTASKGLQIISTVTVLSNKTGTIKCFAGNSLGQHEDSRPYIVTDVRDGFDIFGFDDSVNINETGAVEVAIGEPFKMTCGASVHNYTAMQWMHKGVPLNASENLRFDTSRTDYTNRKILNFDEVNFSDSGSYSCQVRSKDNDETRFKNMTLVVSKPYKPTITESNLKDSEVTFADQKKFSCVVRGLPKPIVTWYKDNVKIQPSKRIHFSNNNQVVKFLAFDYKDEGTYQCVASSKVGTTSKQMNLTIKNKPSNYSWLFGVVAFLIIGLMILIVCMVIKIRRERKLEKELQIAGLANFEKGAIESLNPDLGIDDQAELLPYDKKWEFPIEKLKLGKQLGSGAFGVVMKGVAKGMIEGEESTTVAVKMVKKSADHIYIKALASELKIMVHLGKHLNVVNLLGACTKNVAKKELLVIVEFCRYGNLQNYLLRHRDNFIDQVDPKTGHIDYTIGQEALERTYSVSSNKSSSQSPYMKYAALSFSNSSGPQTPHMVDYRGDNYNGTTAKTDITTVSMSPNSDEEIVLSNNSSVQPEWRSNYHGDYKGNIRPICTKDLLAWTFQVSRGMEYLSSRKILHGDLAARNILLADNNVVKICDFGLAKSIYKNDNYKKKGDGPLPVKWMAIESIRDKVFSTQSDVWSFGIVLWEFFSLARTPYPGMEADERLYNKLLDGYRMEAPDYAPREIYKMMCDCWNAKPVARPTFAKLSERIGSLLEDTVRKHYIDLNDPYLAMNTQRIEEGHSDYLAMLSPPNFENLSSPHHYVNDLPATEDTPGYLPMHSAQIFSPRPDDPGVFVFDVSSNKIRKDKNAEGAELLPMLGVNSESDCDSSACNSPITNSFSNPSYHLPPIVEKDKGKSEQDIVKSSDNYVNMPQNKSVLKDSNPFLSNMGKNVKDVNYVNSNSRDWESVQL